MCGIAGIVSPRVTDLSPLNRMCSAQRHRGPDGYGFLVGDHSAFLQTTDQELPQPSIGRYGLGHVRLAIIDPEARSLQPMCDGQQRYWLSYNGEVYNYKEIRSELQNNGVQFRTDSDSEVVIEAYAFWGVECFKRFNGMWALAIVDTQANQLILSRDRLGIKPLHFAKYEGTLQFSSEIKGLLSTRSDSPKLYLPAVRDFLTRSLTNHSDKTFFEGVYVFNPGHYSVVDMDDPSSINQIPFWSVAEDAEENQVSYSEAVAETQQLLTDAIRLQLRSDVPVGACLSGGVDSSGICGIAAQHADRSMNTFTASNSESQLDETRWAEIVAEYCGFDFHTTLPKRQDFESSLDALIWHQEEPITGTSVFAQWCVMKLARKHGIPVLLDGQGADEIFCGYKKYFPLHLSSLMKQGEYARFIRTAAHFAAYGDRGFFRWHEAARYLPAWMRSDTNIIQTALHGTALENVPNDQSVRLLGGNVQAMQRLDLLTTSVPALLRLEDRNSMAWSIESRVPYLDHRVVEWGLALPASYKLKRGVTKSILRDSLKGSVPEQVLARRNKFNFFAPLQQWINDGLNTRLHHEMQTSEQLRQLVNVDALLESLQQPERQMSASARDFYFRVAMLAVWLRVYEVTV